MCVFPVPGVEPAPLSAQRRAKPAPSRDMGPRERPSIGGVVHSPLFVVLRTRPNQARAPPAPYAQRRRVLPKFERSAQLVGSSRLLSRAPPSSLVVRRVVTTGCVGGSPTGPVSTPPPRRIERELASPDSGVATHLEHPRRRRDRCKRATVATSETAAAPPVQ